MQDGIEGRSKVSAALSRNVIHISDYVLNAFNLIRRMISIREDIAMAFFKRELSPVERFERALREKQAARQKLAGRVDAVTKSTASVPEATMFSTSVDEMRREVLSAADLICWELRSTAVRTRAGNANIALLAPPEPKQLPAPEIERQLIYTLSPLRWREGSEVRRVPAFALVGLPKMLLPVALRHQHVDYLNARRVQTLIHVHGSGGVNSDPHLEAPQLGALQGSAA